MYRWYTQVIAYSHQNIIKLVLLICFQYEPNFRLQ